MTTTTAHAPGTFCWIELATTDQAAATSFYASLFGWSWRDDPMPQGGTYTMCQSGGRDVAAIHTLPTEQAAQGLPAHWFPYVAVASADEAVARAGSLGGTAMGEAFDVMDFGRMAVLRDPTGAVLGVWQAKRFPGVGVRDEPNAMCWNEVLSPDRATAAAFYAALIGWDTSPMPMPTGEYTVFMSGEVGKAGCMQITPEMGPLPPHWATYFAVADCDATTARAKALGATVLHGPEDAPGIGRWAALQDPQGAAFSIIAMAAA
jgi:hypothetical protein